MEEGASRGTAWRRVLAGVAAWRRVLTGVAAWRNVLAGGQRGGWCNQGDSVEEGASSGTAWRMVLAGGQRGGGC